MVLHVLDGLVAIACLQDDSSGAAPILKTTSFKRLMRSSFGIDATATLLFFTHAAHLGEHLARIEHVLKDLTVHAVEGLVLERQGLGVALDDRRAHLEPTPRSRM